MSIKSKVKKRPSLSTLLDSLHLTPLSPAASEPGSASDSPPLEYLQDEDPFARIDPVSPVLLPSQILAGEAIDVPARPRSAASLRPSVGERSCSSPPPSRLRPASTRPAFNTRPSLPSLRVLADMQLTVSPKVCIIPPSSSSCFL